MAEAAYWRLYRCYAKVNLTLEVLGRRPDGYHELASLVQTISLADTLRVAPADDLSCTVGGLELAAEENLVLRAAGLLQAATGGSSGATLTLGKRVPAAAGLGGGSSDAAAALVALNRLWALRLSARRLADLAASLGSDVPYFLRGGLALMRGRGEQLDWLPPMPSRWLVVFVPPHALPDKTAALYGALQPPDFGDGSRTLALAERLRRGEPLRDQDLVNGFTRAARRAFPGLADLWNAAERIAGCPFHLSGAGPALFTLADSAEDARRVARQLGPLGVPARLARTVPRGHAAARMAYPVVGIGQLHPPCPVVQR